MTIDFKYEEGQFVCTRLDPDCKLEVIGLNYCNGGKFYTVTDGEEETTKNEYQLQPFEAEKKGKKKKDAGFQGLRNIGDVVTSLDVSDCL